jgi:outer membrane protein OmpA-like peptidoglycan-associated protein
MERLLLFMLSSLLLSSGCGLFQAEEESSEEIQAEEKQVKLPPRETREVPSKLSSPSITSKHVAYEKETTLVTEIDFKPDDFNLTPEARKKISSLLKKADHGIEKVTLITWADKEYPSKTKKKLSDEQKELAEKRNDQLKNFIQATVKLVKIEAYSMAQRPNIFKRVLSSDEARIKESLVAAGIPLSNGEGVGKAKASKSIILIIPKR